MSNFCTKEFGGELSEVASECGVSIHYVEQTTSTNDIAKQDEFESGDVVVAEFQSSGRGQRGNKWSSEGGENLTFSIIFKPSELSVEYQFYVSKMVAVSLVKVLSDYGISAEVKWPNDIYVGDRKIAGILIENDLLGFSLTKSILGVGLNINQKKFDDDLPNATSMSILTNNTYKRAEVLRSIIGKFKDGFSIINNAEFETIDKEYHLMLYRRKGEHYFRDTKSGKEFAATIERVMPSGEIRLKDNAGNSKRFFFKEVEFL